MRILESLFGPSREEVWAQFCTQINGQVAGGGWRGSKVQAQVGDWTLTLDTFSQSDGNSSTTYTRLRAPFLNHDQFRFNIYRAGWGTDLAKFFGMQDLEIGDPLFDQKFVVQSNAEAKVRALLANPRIRELLHAQTRIGQFTVKDNERMAFHTSRYPEGVDVLYFQVVGVIKDLTLLKSLYDLFAEVLNHLCHLDSAYLEDIDLHLRALRAPGGQITADHVVLWDGDPARAAAAQSLGRLGAREAVPDLIEALAERDPDLRVNAAWALGEIGDPAAIPALIPLLGEDWPPEAPQISGYAGAALRRLGQDALVDAFDAALQGRPDGVELLRCHRGPELTEALRRLLDSRNQFRVAYGAWSLGELGIVELLPQLRVCEREFRRSSALPQLERITEAVKRLETQARLPRPATSPATSVQELPRPSHGPCE